MNHRMLLRIVAVLFSTLLFAGCAGSSGISTDRSDKFVYASIGGVNHTDRFIYEFSIDGAPGRSMRAFGSANAGSCCIGVPRVYQPGMKVTVTWNVPEGRKDVIKTKVVEVEPYTRPGSVYAHIFPNDVVRVVVSFPDATSSQHPIPYPVNPNRKQGSQQ